MLVEPQQSDNSLCYASCRFQDKPIGNYLGWRSIVAFQPLSMLPDTHSEAGSNAL